MSDETTVKTAQEQYINVSSAIDKVQEKQIVVIEVYGKPLDFDTFLAALEQVQEVIK